MQPVSLIVRNCLPAFCRITFRKSPFSNLKGMLRAVASRPVKGIGHYLFLKIIGQASQHQTSRADLMDFDLHPGARNQHLGLRIEIETFDSCREYIFDPHTIEVL